MLRLTSWMLLIFVAPVAWAGAQNARQAEFLDRGVVAVKTTDGVFVSWRLLGNESYGTSFNIYRDGQKLNRRPLATATNYLDSAGTTSSVYTVRSLGPHRFRDTAAVWSGPYHSIPLRKPVDAVTPAGEAYSYRANDASVGDLDGDGQYEVSRLVGGYRPALSRRRDVGVNRCGCPHG